MSDGAQPRPVSPIARPVGGWRAWLRTARPRQWAKNGLVFGAPVAAGVLTQPGVLARVCAAFVAFCLLSSGAYLINDVADAAEDRRHPVKRHRPIASGAISEWPALAAGVGVVMLGIALSRAVGWGLVGVGCGYALLNAGYTGVLRGVAVLDIAAIAGAFVLRALAGGVAADVHVSGWFIVVVSSVALFVAAGKRYADLLDPAARRSRPVLKRYSVEFLRSVIVGAGAVALAAYCMWAFEAVHPSVVPWRELTIVPFLLAILRYRLLVTRGQGGAPEQILFSDVVVQIAGGAWLTLFCLGV